MQILDQQKYKRKLTQLCTELNVTLPDFETLKKQQYYNRDFDFKYFVIFPCKHLTFNRLFDSSQTFIKVQRINFAQIKDQTIHYEYMFTCIHELNKLNSI